MSQSKRLLAELNPAQRQAVETLAGPLLVLAGAGTGKTRVVTYRMANLILHGTPPQRMLAVTFTRKAAGEMLARLKRLIRLRGNHCPTVGTFHSLCLEILRRHAPRLGFPRGFAIYDRGDQLGVIRSVLRELATGGVGFRPADLAALFSTWKAQGLWPHQAAAQAPDDRTHVAAMIYRRYQNALRLAGAMDFDDLLLMTERLFEEHPQVLEEEAARFDHVLVDEYQDTNPPQYRIIRRLAAPHGNFCAVGDDDQSIYSWRGAEVEHILRFRRDWPQARIVRLEENYRSTQPILDMANRVIAFNLARHPKKLRSARGPGPKPRIVAYEDEEEEARGTVAQIQAAVRSRQARPGDHAVLFRTNDQLRPFEAELRRVGLDYTVVGSTSFFDRKEVRDLLAYLKLVQRPEDDVALLRVINTPGRGIGQQTVESLLASSVRQSRPVWRVLNDPQWLGGLSPRVQQAVKEFAALVEQLRRQARSGCEMRPLLEQLIRQTDYPREIQRISKTQDESRQRQQAVEGLLETAAAFDREHAAGSLREFLDQVAVADRAFATAENERFDADKVVLITLHGAKGLEFPRVFFVGLEEGLLPHRHSLAEGDRAIDEERRLCYVGITRAQDVLVLSYCRHRTRRGRRRPSTPSRFLYEAAGQADMARQVAQLAGQAAAREQTSR